MNVPTNTPPDASSCPDPPPEGEAAEPETAPRLDPPGEETWPEELTRTVDPATEQRLAAIEAELAGLRSAVDRFPAAHTQAIEIVARCQQETAEVRNRDLERHALRPAVRAVGALVEELVGLARRARAASQQVQNCPVSAPLVEAVLTAEQVALDQLAALGAERIVPASGDTADPELHDIKGAETTCDPEKHGAVARLVVAGLTYRDEILARAQVMVFRCQDAATSGQNRKEQNHDYEE